MSDGEAVLDRRAFLRSASVLFAGAASVLQHVWSSERPAEAAAGAGQISASLAPPADVAFPLYAGQLDGSRDLAGSWRTVDNVARTLYAVDLQGPSDNDVLDEVPGIVAQLGKGNVRLSQLYQLMYLSFGGKRNMWAVDRYSVQRTSNDGGKIYCIADPGMRTAWIGWVRQQLAQYGLRGVWIDGPAGFPGDWDGKDANGFDVGGRLQYYAAQFLSEIRAGLPNAYITINSEGTYNAGSVSELAMHVDEVSSEGTFAPVGVSGTDYDQAWAHSRVANLVHYAFDLHRNVTFGLGGQGYRRAALGHALAALLAGHPYEGAAGFGSVATFFVDGHVPLIKDFSAARLGQPAAAPTSNPQKSVWTRKFQNGTLTLDLGAAEAKFG
jgi:hypothetical protein